MMLADKKDLLVLALLTIVLLWIALPQGLQTVINYYTPHDNCCFNLSILGTGMDVFNLLGYRDPGSYILGAQKLTRGWLTGADAWFFGCWPPGMFLLESFFMKLFGLDCPIVLCLSLTVVGCWTLALWNFYLSLTQVQSRTVALTLTMSLCFTQLFERFFLRSGVVLSESVSTALVILSLSLVIRCREKNVLLFCLIAALSLAAAAYLRAQVEIFILCLLGVVVAIITSYLVFSSSYKQFLLKPYLWQRILQLPLHRLVLVIMAAQFFMLPFRVYNYKEFGTISWLRTDYYWQQMWQAERITNNNGGHFAVLGGVAVATKVDPSLAKEMAENVDKFGANYYSVNDYKQAVLSTFVRHPFRWLITKSQYLPYGWFDSFGGPKEKAMQIENWFYAIILLPIVALACCRILGSLHNIFADISVDVFFLSTLMCQLFLAIFVHFEPRYFYFLKILSLVTAAIYISLYWRSGQHKNMVTDNVKQMAEAAV